MRAEHSTTHEQHREGGQALAEFALCLPILCVMLLAIIQFGQMIWTSMDLTSATRDGARRAAVARADTTTSPDAQVRSVLLSSLDRTNPQSVTIRITGGWNRDDRVTVRTSLPYQLDIMGVVVWSGDIDAESQVRIG